MWRRAPLAEQAMLIQKISRELVLRRRRWCRVVWLKDAATGELAGYENRATE